MQLAAMRDWRLKRDRTSGIRGRGAVAHLDQSGRQRGDDRKTVINIDEVLLIDRGMVRCVDDLGANRNVVQPTIKESTMTVKPIPDGYHAVTPYLTVRGAAKTIEFLKKAFGAETVFEPMKRPDGLIMHAELKIGDSRVMVADASRRRPSCTSMFQTPTPPTSVRLQPARPPAWRRRTCSMAIEAGA
jgi:uncharacterized glyoxalase superfamily protein PhnB